MSQRLGLDEVAKFHEDVGVFWITVLVLLGKGGMQRLPSGRLHSRRPQQPEKWII